MPRRNLNIVLLAIVIGSICSLRSNQLQYANTISSAMNTINDFYIEPVKRRELFEGAMRGMFEKLDENSAYIPPRRYDRLVENLDQEFGGVGIEVGEDQMSNRLMILSPLTGTPAANAKLQPGDILMKIEGKDTTNMKLTDSVGLMRGKEGTNVRIEVQRFETKKVEEVVVERAIIPIKSVLGDSRNLDGSWNYVLEDSPQVGYLRVVNFGEYTAIELNEILQKLLPEINALIIDLRGNPGGLLDAAVATCGLFLDSGAIVSIKGRNGIIGDSHVATHGDTIVPTDIPLAILVDNYSASASEIVSACLQDHDRAVVVGQRSYGKGTVQTVRALEGGRSAMKLTTATYWRPSGKNIHRLSKATEEDDWGVSPNEGYEVVLSDRDMLQVLRKRRIRDVVVRVRDALDLSVPVEPESETSNEDTNSDQTAKEETAPDQETGDLHEELENKDGENKDSETAPNTTTTSESSTSTDAPESNSVVPMNLQDTDWRSLMNIKDPQMEKALEFVNEKRSKPVKKAA